MLADKLKIANDIQDIKVSYGSALEELKLVKETSAAQIEQLKNENRDLHRENDELVSALEEESDRSRENIRPKPMVYDFSQQTEEMKEFLPPRSTGSPRDSVSGMADKMARVEAMCESYRADILCLTQELKTSKNDNETLYDQFKHLIKYRDQYKELQDSRDMMAKEIRRLTAESVPAAQHAKMEADYRLAQSKAKSAEDKFRDIISRLSQSETVCRDQATRIDQLQASIAALQLTRKELQAEISQLRDALADKDEELTYEQTRYIQNQKHMNFELEKCQLEIARLKDHEVDREGQVVRIQELEKQLKAVRLQKEEIGSERAHLVRRIDQLESMVGDLEIELSNQGLVKDSNRALNEKLAQTEAKYAQAISSLSLLSHDKAYLKQQEAVALDSKDMIRKQLDDLERDKLQSRTLIDSLRQDILERDRQINKLSSGLNTTDTQLTYYSTHFSKASTELQLLRSRCDDLEKSISTKDGIITSQTEAVKNASQKIKELQDTNDEYKEFMKGLHETITDQDATIDKLEKQNADLFQDTKKSVGFLTQSQAKNKELTAKNKEIIAELKLSIAKAQSVEAEIASTKDVLDKATKSQEMLAQVSQELVSTKEKLGDMFKAIHSMPGNNSNRDERKEGDQENTVNQPTGVDQIKRTLAETINIVDKLSKISDNSENTAI